MFKKLLLLFAMTSAIFLAITTSALALENEFNSNGIEIKIERNDDKAAVNKEIEYKIKLTDPNGNPIQKAFVNLEAVMSGAESTGGHGGMDMGSEKKPIVVEAREVGPGTYEASIEYDMSGEWNLLLGATTNLGIANAAFKETIQAEDPSWVVVGLFIAGMVTTGTVFANKKRVKASEIASDEKISPDDVYAD